MYLFLSWPSCMTTVASEVDGVPSLELEGSPAEVKRYQRQKLIAGIVSLILSLALLAVTAFSAGPLIDRFVRTWTGDDRWLRLIALGFVYAAGIELLTLPLTFWSSFILEHRYHLSNQSLAAWVWRHIKGYLIGGPVGLVLLLGLYALLWFGGSWWWLWATAGWLAVTLLVGQLLPVLILPLFYKVTRLDDPPLLERLHRLVAGTGLAVEGIYRMDLSAETRKVNAALAGLGRTRRVLLGDTLLEQFTPEEIEVVFAHEVGHHVHRHLPKLVVCSVVLAAAGFWLINVVCRWLAPELGYAGGFTDPAALPLLLFVVSAFGLILTPAQNALSRFFERQCDRYALERTHLRDAYRSAFIKLARINKSDPDPNPLVAWFLYDHPPIRQRLAMAESDR
jgi:STE24 endopeptidase